MNRCKDCRYFGETVKSARYGPSKDLENRGYSDCTNESKIYYALYDHCEPGEGDHVVYEDAEGYSGASLIVGPEFGCVHFAEREK